MTGKTFQWGSKNHEKILTIIACIACLSGCATAYQPFQLFGTGGYSDSQLSADTYQVTYYGNHATSMETLNTLLLYRCAELTVEKGFDGFDVTKGYGRMPLSVLGGFRTVEYTIRMYKGPPTTPGPQSHVARDVLQKFGSYVKKS